LAIGFVLDEAAGLNFTSMIFLYERLAGQGSENRPDPVIKQDDVHEGSCQRSGQPDQTQIEPDPVFWNQYHPDCFARQAM
jgi:hypothetical protein